jgi:hypothetical protein
MRSVVLLNVVAPADLGLKLTKKMKMKVSLSETDVERNFEKKNLFF